FLGFLLRDYLFITTCLHFLASSLGVVSPRQRARYACWHFLASSLGVVSSYHRRLENASVVCLNVYRRIRKRTDIPLYHFTRKYSWYRYLYFSKGWLCCVKCIYLVT